MAEYKATIMSTNVNANNKRFTREYLEKVFKDNKKIPVILEGTPIGWVKSYELKDDVLSCTFVSELTGFDEVKLYLVPMGFVNEKDLHLDEESVIVVERMDLRRLFVVDFPVDHTMTPIEKV